MSDWRNRSRKVSVMFPANLWQQPLKEITDDVDKFPMPHDVNARIMSSILTEPTVSQGHHKAPRIHCNVTWRKHPQFPFITIPQLDYDSADEARLFRIIEKYGGKIVDSDLRMNQYEQTEINSSGKEYTFENAYEILKEKDHVYNTRK